MNARRQHLQVLGAGIASLLLAMGVARFAYTPLLPLMQRQAGLGVAAGAWLAAINYTGYFLGALLISRIDELELKDRLFRAGLVLAVLTTGLMAVSTDPWVWAVSRFLAGLASAAGMLLGTALVLHWLVRHDHPGELGIHFSGIGLGIAGTAAAVWGLSAVALDWRQQWIAFTIAGLLLLVPALTCLPSPDRSGLTQAGRALDDRPPGAAFERLLLWIYFFTGVGFVVSATFIVAIVERLPQLAGRGNLVFLFVGLAAAPACVIWDRVARRSGEINALILAAVLQIGGILLPVLGDGLAGAVAGALLFGSTFIGMVSLVLAMAGRYYPRRPAKLMGKLTAAYGLAQIVAPALTAILVSRWGGYAPGLYVAAAAMAIAAVLLLRLRGLQGEPATPAREPD